MIVENLDLIRNASVRTFLGRVIKWAQTQKGLKAAALAGSFARQEARPDSDVDLILLAEKPAIYVDETDWVGAFGKVDQLLLEDWGKVTSVRVFYQNGLEVEFGIAPDDWGADLDDAGDSKVIEDGILILWEKGNILSTRVAARINQAS
jgi:predicted nucleotidyltransferase